MDSCRTCLREAISNQGYGIFDPEVRPATDLLMASTSLKIFEDDGLPTRICDDCFAKLSSFQLFCQLSIESDLIYRRNHHVKVELCEETTPTTATASGFTHLPDEKPVAENTDSIVVVASSHLRRPIKSETKWSPGKDDRNDDRTAAAAAADGDDDDDDDEDDAAYDDGGDYGEDDNDNDAQQYAPTNDSSDANNSRSPTGGRKRAYAPRPGAKTTDKSTKYTCDECGKFYYEKVRLAGHLRQHYGLRPFPCDRCPKQYDKYSKLRVHQQKHAPPPPDQPTVCPHEGCGKTYRLPRYAQDHYERIHMGLRPKVRVECMCDTCGKSFMTRSSLLQHMKSHMDIEQYPYQCDVCGKRFLAKNGHMLHMLRHNNIRNFPCPLCPARMVSQLELNYHVAKHDKSVPWPCPECKMVFQRKASLRRHELKVHRGYKPYVCSFCSRAFGKKLSLINHERLHTGERPFACPICDRRFVQQVHMKSHVKTHNKNKDESR